MTAPVGGVARQRGCAGTAARARSRAAWRVAIGLVVFATLATLSAPAPDATAQTGGARRAPTITLVDQTTWVAAGGEFVLRLRPPGTVAPTALPDLELSVAVHPAVATRTAFQRTLTQRPNTSPLVVTATPLASLTPDESGTYEIHVGVQDPASPRDTNRVVLRNGGVYPVVVELRPPGGGAVRGELITHLLFVPTPPAGPRLGVTVIVPIARPPALQPDGSVDFDGRAGETFSALASVLVDASTDGVVFDPNPETLAALTRRGREEDRAALDALRRITANRPVVTNEPFVPVPRAAYTGTRGLEALRTLLERGRAVTEDALASPDDARVTLLTAGTDESHLPEVGVDARVVVPERLLLPATQRVTLANAIALRRGPGRGAGSIPAVVADSGLAAHFTGDHPTVLAAHQLIADLATIYFDNPGRERAVVVLPPRSTPLRPAQLSAVLAGITASPVLQFATLDQQFARNPSGPRPTARVLAPPGSIKGPAGLGPVRADVASLSLSFADDLDRVTNFSDRMLVAQSSDLRGVRRSNYINGLVRAVAAERHQFRLPRRASARLTAKTARIPITVHSDASYAAKVLLEVASDKLRFPGGATRQLVLTRRNTTAQLRVATQGSGTFPLRVVLKTPDGRLVLAESRFTVQSTAVSGVGVFLSVGALLVLGGWWIRHNRRYRPRDRRREAARSRA